MQNLKTLCSFAVLLFGLQAPLYAASKPAEIHIQSDRADMNYKTNINHYYGHVIARTNQITIKGNRMTTYRGKDLQIVRVKIFGNEANLIVKNKKAPLYAKAEIIQLYPQKHVIELLKDAHARQNGNALSAPKMTYNTETATLHTEANQHQQSRIELVGRAVT